MLLKNRILEALGGGGVYMVYSVVGRNEKTPRYGKISRNSLRIYLFIQLVMLVKLHYSGDMSC